MLFEGNRSKAFLNISIDFTIDLSFLSFEECVMGFYQSNAPSVCFDYDSISQVFMCLTYKIWGIGDFR